MRYGLSLFVLLAVAACSRDPEPPAGGAAPTAAAPHAPAADDSVAAVQQSPGKSPVTLRFVLSGKPMVGSAIPVQLDFTAPETITQLAVRAEGTDLVVDAASASFMLALPEAEKVVSHAVTVTPQAAGFSELIVHVQPPGDGAAEVVYAIPLMADAAAPATK
jgi:hypothetical protein